MISFGCNALVAPFQQLLEGPMEVLLCERVNDLSHSLFHLLNCLITTASKLKEKAKVTGSKVWTISCPGGNATDPIWRVLASSIGISSRTPLKPQHSNPNPNHLAHQLVYWLPYSSHTSHHPSQTLCLPWISYATQKLMLDSCKMLQKQSEAFHTFLWHHFFQV